MAVSAVLPGARRRRADDRHRDPGRPRISTRWPAGIMADLAPSCLVHRTIAQPSLLDRDQGPKTRTNPPPAMPSSAVLSPFDRGAARHRCRDPASLGERGRARWSTRRTRTPSHAALKG
jgi:hypothetical protein